MRRATLLVAMVASVLVLVSGVALAAAVVGTNKGERIDAADGVTNGPDAISGAGGNDNIFARNGDDRAFGDSGSDRVRGQGGFDQLFGGSENDKVFGAGGKDRLFAGTGTDTLRGGISRDFLNADDNVGGDIVDGGPGPNDRCVADGNDIIDFGDCESVDT